MIKQSKEEKLLVDNEEYLKAGIHIGTKSKTKYMKRFIYRVRQDGLVVLNVNEIDKRLRIAINFLSQFKPQEILVVSRRENGWKAIDAFSKYTGILAYKKRYPPGILTNPALDNFIEAKVLLVTDPWPDRNAIKDASRIGIPIVALCDTNNNCNFIDLVIPCNNKGRNSLALIFWLLTKEMLKKTGKIKDDKEFKAKLEEFLE